MPEEFSASSWADIKRQTLENRRSALIEEYAAANAQLSRSLSEVERVRLDRQVKDLERQIEEVEGALKESHPAPGVPKNRDRKEDNAVNGENLSPGQRSRLEQEHRELQMKFDSLTRAIAALDIDIGRTIEAYRRQPLEEQRDERAFERQQVASRMAQIETILGD